MLTCIKIPFNAFHCPLHSRLMTSAINSFITDKAYVDGKWISSSRQPFEVRNPDNNEVIGSAANCSEQETDLAIHAAKRAFESWSTTPAKVRSGFLRKMFDLQMQHQAELANLISREMGKPLPEANGEIVYGASFLEWFAEQARRINGEILQSPFQDKVMMYMREAAGPTAIITPWNFPNAMITRKLAAALAAGCTAVIRPSEDTPFSGIAIAKIAEEAGIPAGVVNVIPSERLYAPVIGQKLSQSPEIAVLSFTGSTVVGKQLLEWGSTSVKRICLELGGNAPFIVFDSADADRAAEGCIASKFRNSGQTCVCANRILVQKGIHDEFVAKLAVAMHKSLRVGRPLDPGVTIGPLVNERAVEKVKAHVDDAIAKGATLLVGGKRIDGQYFEPTLIDGVKEGMRICQEETFGPVAGICTFETEEQALQIANSARTGLAGYFYSRDLSQVLRVSRKLQVGMVGVNEGVISCCEAPFGGVKESGLGREGSHMGVDEFLSVKYMCLGGIKL